MLMSSDWNVSTDYNFAKSFIIAQLDYKFIWDELNN